MEKTTLEFLLTYRLAVQVAVQRGLDLLSREQADVGAFVRAYQSQENWAEVFKLLPGNLVSDLPHVVVTFDAESEGVVRFSVDFFGHGAEYHLHLPLESLQKTDPSPVAGYMLGAWIMHRLGPAVPPQPEPQAV